MLSTIFSLSLSHHFHVCFQILVSFLQNSVPFIVTAVVLIARHGKPNTSMEMENVLPIILKAKDITLTPMLK